MNEILAFSVSNKAIIGDEIIKYTVKLLLKYSKYNKNNQGNKLKTSISGLRIILAPIKGGNIDNNINKGKVFSILKFNEAFSK